VVCERPFTWRKKWDRCWDEVTTCSKSCSAKRRAAKSSNTPSRPQQQATSSDAGLGQERDDAAQILSECNVRDDGHIGERRSSCADSDSDDSMTERERRKAEKKLAKVHIANATL